MYLKVLNKNCCLFKSKTNLFKTLKKLTIVIYESEGKQKELKINAFYNKLSEVLNLKF